MLYLGGGYRGELQLPPSAAVISTIKPPFRTGPETCPFQWSVNCTLYCFLLPGLFLLCDWVLTGHEDFFQIFLDFPPIMPVIWKQSFAMKGYCSKFYGECVGDPFDPYLKKRKKKSSPAVSKICLVCLCGKGYLKGEVITHWVWPREKTWAALAQSSERKCHSDEENVAEQNSKLILQAEEIHLEQNSHFASARYLHGDVCWLTSVRTPMKGGAGARALLGAFRTWWKRGRKRGG